jgi:hypothetical protein
MMTTWHRFVIGGAGALLPVLATLLAVDLAYVIDHFRDYTLGIYVGTGLRYLLLATLGGAVAALNSDEKKPIKLVQLGIAAPALIASYVNAQPPPKQFKAETHLGFISVANAMHAKRSADATIVLAAEFKKNSKSPPSFLEDLATGLKGPKALNDRLTEPVPPIDLPNKDFDLDPRVKSDRPDYPSTIKR